MENRLNYALVFQHIISGLIVLFTIFNRPPIVSALCFISFVVVLLQFIFIIFRSKFKTFFWDATRIIRFSFVAILINLILKNGWLSIDYLTNYFLFVAAIMTMGIIMNSEISYKTINCIIFINIVISCLYPFAHLFVPEQNHFSDMALNFSNPNLTGMFILQSALYLRVGLSSYKNFPFKLFIFALMVYNTYLIYETGARNCLIAVTAFYILCINIPGKQKLKYSKKIIALINAVPIIFIPVYLSFIDLIVNKGWFNFLVQDGKPITSRVAIWTNRFEQIKDSWLIGNYMQASGNAHNSYMVILSSYGVIVAVLVYLFFYKVCCALNDGIESKMNNVALLAFFAVILMGLGEGCLFSGGICIHNLCCGFLIIAKYNFSDNNGVKNSNCSEENSIHKIRG